MQRLVLQAKQRLTEISAATTMIKFLSKKLAEQLGVKIKRIDSLDIDRAWLIFDGPLDLGKLRAVPHKGNRYFPAGEKEGYIVVETAKPGATSMIVNVN